MGASAIGKILPIAAAIITAALPFGPLISALIVGGAAILGGFISSSVERLPDQEQLPSGRELKINDRTTQKAMPVIYGTRKIGSNDVFMGTSGDRNEYLWIVHAIGEGPLEGVALDNGDPSRPLIYIDGKPIWEYKAGLIDWWWRAGGELQDVVPELVAAIPECTDRLKFTGYLVFRILSDFETFSSIPRREAVIKGRRLHDFRTDIVDWSDNPVLILYDYMCDRLGRGRYGLQFPADIFETSSWIAAANYCDAVPWKYNGVISRQDSAISVIEQILGHFRGTLGWDQGKFWLRYADARPAWEVPVYTINNEQIAQDESGNALVQVQQPSRYSLPEAVRIKWTDPVKDWVNDDIMVGGSGQIQDLQFLGYTDRKMAANMGLYNLERSRLNRMISLVGRDDLLELESHDLIRLNCSELGLTNQLARVESMEITQAGLVNLGLVWETEDLYDEVYQADLGDYYDTDFPLRTEPPPSVVNVSVVEQTYYYRERTMVRLLVDFDPPTGYPWFSHVDIYISFDGTNWESLYPAKSDFIIEAVEEGAQYWLRLHSVSTFGIAQSIAQALLITHTVLGASGIRPPSPNPLYINANVTSVALYSEPVIHPDIATYEFRLGPAWNQGIKVVSLGRPSITYSGVKPGYHQFNLNTLGTNGLYGAIPQSASVTLQEPPAYHEEVQRFSIDFTAGAHDNTEATPEGWLKCSHTGGVLVGTYTSSSFQRTEAERLLAYVNYTFSSNVGGLTWDELVPIPTTWADGFGTSRWYDIFATESVGQINISLKYRESPSHPWVQEERLELLTTTIFGADFQVLIKIADANPGLNLVVKSAELVLCKQIEIPEPPPPPEPEETPRQLPRKRRSDGPKL